MRRGSGWYRNCGSACTGVCPQQLVRSAESLQGRRGLLALVFKAGLYRRLTGTRCGLLAAAPCWTSSPLGAAFLPELLPVPPHCLAVGIGRDVDLGRRPRFLCRPRPRFRTNAASDVVEGMSRRLQLKRSARRLEAPIHNSNVSRCDEPTKAKFQFAPTHNSLVQGVGDPHNAPQRNRSLLGTRVDDRGEDPCVVPLEIGSTVFHDAQRISGSAAGPGVTEPTKPPLVQGQCYHGPGTAGRARSAAEQIDHPARE